SPPEAPIGTTDVATTEPDPIAAEAASVDVPVDVPTVASTLEVPASPQVKPAAADQDGGEWDLLVDKVRAWISSGQLQEQWQAARTPLSLLAGLIAVLLVLRVYSAVLGVLESIPLLPGLLELAGLVAVVQFSLTRLVRSNDRREVIVGLKQRWQSFRGRS
ncbi:MAG: CAAD domain-containing protein, partial [Vulcanococcus sp.]